MENNKVSQDQFNELKGQFGMLQSQFDELQRQFGKLRNQFDELRQELFHMENRIIRWCIGMFIGSVILMGSLGGIYINVLLSRGG